MHVELTPLHWAGAQDAPGADLNVVRLVEAVADLSVAPEGGGVVRMTPGVYSVEVRLSVVEATVTACEVVFDGSGVDHCCPLDAVSDGLWRARVTLASSACPKVVRVRGRGARVLFVSASIDDQARDEPPPPSIKAGLLTIARAAFRALPRSVRARLMQTAASARAIRSLRRVALAGDPVQEPTPGAGRLVRGTVADDPEFRFRDACDAHFAVARGVRDPAYVGPEDTPPALVSPRATIVAFYLPQYHPIPENDAWWGKGFTEWTNVSKATPQFVGHYQPRLPGELGFYDLRTPGVLQAQADLARSYGVGAFAFHYYWFAGRRILERPLDAYHADATIPLPFLVCWANENWTRRWDGDDTQVLLEQRHTLADHSAVFADIARYAEDPRYLRIAGRPVIVVYRPEIIDDARAMTDIWREAAHRRGWPGVHLVAANAFAFSEPETLGFDALCEFPPHGVQAARLNAQLRWLNDNHAGAVFDYREVAQAACEALAARRRTGAVVYPGVMPGWDNEARRPGAGATYHASTPSAYEQWLEAAVACAERTLAPDHRLVFVNSWNEWAEGAHLEPCRRFGRAYLAATARVVQQRI